MVKKMERVCGEGCCFAFCGDESQLEELVRRVRIVQIDFRSFAHLSLDFGLSAAFARLVGSGGEQTRS